MLHLMSWVLATVLSAGPATTWTTAVVPGDTSRHLADMAMNKLKVGDVDGAYETLIPHLTWPEGVDHLFDARDQAKKMREAMSRTNAPMGEIEFLARESVGKSLVRYVYLEKWDRMAVVWKFTFYHGRDGWTVYAVDWSNASPAIQELFQK